MKGGIHGKVLGYSPQLRIIDTEGLPATAREVGKNELMRTGAKIVGMVNHDLVVSRGSVCCIILDSVATIQLGRVGSVGRP